MRGVSNKLCLLTFFIRVKVQNGNIFFLGGGGGMLKCKVIILGVPDIFSIFINF